MCQSNRPLDFDQVLMNLINLLLRPNIHTTNNFFLEKKNILFRCQHKIKTFFYFFIFMLRQVIFLIGYQKYEYIFGFFSFSYKQTHLI
jgi:hypothetical protein